MIVKRLILLGAIFFFVFYLNIASAALGISPAKLTYNFAPGTDITIKYSIISDNPDMTIEIYSEGDFAEYVEFSETTITGPGTVTATIHLPASFSEPGARRLLIGAKEVPPEDQFLGTAINIRAAVVINVPYPGKYIESDLSVPDGNVNENLPIDLTVRNRGTEDVTASADINFYIDSGEKIYSMPFVSTFILSGGDHHFKRYLDTATFKAGSYFAQAFIDYGTGTLKEANASFKIGSLVVSISNFTNRVEKNGIQPFNIDILSEWNDDLGEVYADVNISDDTRSLFFRTPSTDLKAWEEKKLTGFVETKELEVGEYNSIVTLHYGLDEKTRRTGTVEVYAGSNVTMIAVIAAIVLAILVMAFFVLRHRRRKKK